MIKNLQSIRFVFALMIFLHHSALPISALGAFPVSFFLMLSGFVLMKGSNGGIEDNKNRLPFFLKRLRKIYPTHILCLLLAVIVLFIIGKQIDWVSIIPNVFLVHSWIPNGRFTFSGNSVSWYLSVMVFCYAMFPFLAKLIKRGGGRFVLVVLVVYAIAFAIVPDSHVHSLIYINPLFRIVDFCLGIWLHSICTNESAEKISARLMELSPLKKTIIEGGLVLLTLSFIVISQYIEKRYIYASFWWIPSMLFIYVLFIFDNNGGIISKILNRKWFVILGSISFVFYMLHIQILTINNYLMENIISMNYYLNGVLVLLVTIGLSYLLTYYYMPMFTKSNKLYNNEENRI